MSNISYKLVYLDVLTPPSRRETNDSENVQLLHNWKLMLYICFQRTVKH